MRVPGIMVGVAVMVSAVSATAQQRGTVEFGGFASNTSFDDKLALERSWGGGARVGMFLHSRLEVEFEGGGASANRAPGLTNVNVGVLSGRLTWVPVKVGALSLLVGGGVDHTDTYYLESYGYHGLIGAKFALWDGGAIRADGIQSYMMHNKGTNMAVHVGLTLYRNPMHKTVTNNVVQTVVAPPAIQMEQRPDSVSAAETRRLRNVESDHRALRDSLARSRPIPSTSSAAALATMQQMVYFKNDRSDLSDSAKAILREKVMVFRANPAMRIVIVGFASQPGTTDYNMALGLRRGEAAKAYLVSQGVEPIRIEIATRGEGQLMVEGPGESADAANRRGQFRLLIADPFLVPPPLD